MQLAPRQARYADSLPVQWRCLTLAADHAAGHQRPATRVPRARLAARPRQRGVWGSGGVLPAHQVLGPWAWAQGGGSCGTAAAARRCPGAAVWPLTYGALASCGRLRPRLAWRLVWRTCCQQQEDVRGCCARFEAPPLTSALGLPPAGTAGRSGLRSGPCSSTWCPACAACWRAPRSSDAKGRHAAAAGLAGAHGWGTVGYAACASRPSLHIFICHRSIVGQSVRLQLSFSRAGGLWYRQAAPRGCMGGRGDAARCGLVLRAGRQPPEISRLARRAGLGLDLAPSPHHCTLAPAAPPSWQDPPCNPGGVAPAVR